MRLLELVQLIMADLSLEEVENFEDSEEATQVALFIRDTFYNVMGSSDWRFNEKMISLESYANNSKPVLMRLPPNVVNIGKVQYLDEETGNMTTVKYIEPELFIEELGERNVGTNVKTYTGCVGESAVPIKVFTNRSPRFYTSFEEDVLCFDSFNQKYDDNLQTHKSLCWAYQMPVFQIDNDFEIDMPEDFFWSYFVPEVKIVCAMKLLETVNQKDISDAKRGRSRAFNKSSKVPHEGSWMNKSPYGRK